MAIFEIKNCKKSFADTKVLKGIDFSVEEGKVTSIIGASGGGKSTLLRICTFLEKMDSGEMIFDGETICKNIDGKAKYVTDEKLSRYRQKLGLVFQNFNLFPHYTVLKNLMDAAIVVQK
ncbi:MAG: ATP-binding cassette domain-containing protein, partial [Lachnospiraceae bacterium]|nr:ATP-binding cassette domain-containing protein [Lachnospiraceae bacterium]